MEMRLRYAVRDHVPVDPAKFSPERAAMYLGYLLGVSSELSERLKAGPQISFWFEYARLSGIDMFVAQGVSEQIFASYSKNLDFIAGVNIGRAAASFYTTRKFRPEMVLDLCRYYEPDKNAKDILESVTEYTGSPYECPSNEFSISEPHATDPRLEYVMAMTPSAPNLGVSGGWVNDPPIFRSTLAKTFTSEGDANYWVLNNSGKSSINGEQGKVYAVYDNDVGRWVLWLETWENYFGRPHLCQTEEHVKAWKEEIGVKLDKQLQAEINEENRKARHPVNLVVAIIVGLVLVWQLLRFFF